MLACEAGDPSSILGGSTLKEKSSGFGSPIFKNQGTIVRVTKRAKGYLVTSGSPMAIILSVRRLAHAASIKR